MVSLETLRHKIEQIKECQAMTSSKNFLDVDQEEADLYIYHQGMIAAFEELLAEAQGMSFKQMQMAKKKGTL